MISKVRTYVGFSVKMGKAKIGTDKIISANNAPYIILYDATLAENGLKKIQNRCDGSKFFCVPMEEVFPNHNCKAIGICDRNLATAIIKEMEE